MKKTYDIIIIGSGPGGEGAAMKASKEGKQVAVIDDYFQEREALEETQQEKGDYDNRCTTRG